MTNHCPLCTSNKQQIDYKDVESLKRFLDPYGRIMKHRRSGVCARHQRKLATAIKRARLMALLPFIVR
ncbi:MAG: 30S ribosomal protein S18 [Patescibacteria group bacterium]|nr:30S ribosomal protein S18 [Patescibacteria group bacterium]